MPWLAVAMGAGALSYLLLREEPASWTGPACCGLALVLLVCVRGWGGLREAAWALLFIAFGFTSGQWANWRALPAEALPSRAAVVTANVRTVELIPEGRRITLDAVRLTPDSPPLHRTVRVRLRANDPAAPEVGDQVRVRALIRPPSPPAYPGAWDLQRDAWFSGIAGYGMALGPVEVLERQDSGGVAGWWRGLRHGINSRVMAGLPGSAGPIAATLLTGGTAAIPPADRAAFRDSGLAHLLAVAGLHIGAVMGLVFWATRFALALSEHAALRWPIRAIAGVVALLAGAGYAALTGGHVPVLRSFAMASLVTLALLAGRRALSLRGLALAACAILLVSPQEVGGVSFQMSFSAVLALIAGFEAVRPWLAGLHRSPVWWWRVGGHVAALALTSLLAGTASAPFGAFHFGHIQLYYVVANLVAVPICAMVSLPLGLLALALMPLGLEWLALAPMGWSLHAILWIGRSVSAWPAAVVAVPHIPGWGLAVFSLGLAWLGLWCSRARLIGLLPMALGLLSPLVTNPPDILISAEARLIAVRTGGEVYLQAVSGASNFTRDAWLAYLGTEQAMAFPKPGAAPRPGLQCGPAACQAALRGGMILVLRRDTAPADGCGQAQLLLAPEPARGACPGSVPTIDRYTVWRDGAHAAWLTDAGVEILSDRAYRGVRPWVPPPPTPRRNVPALPMADTEPLGSDAASTAAQ